MSKNVVLTLESRFMDEYGEYANLPVFNAHGSIVGYVGGEVPESGNPCEFNRLNDEGFTFCADATEVVRLKAENAKLRELCAGLHMAYVETLNECESLDEGLIWEYSEMVDAELAKSHARFEAARRRFDVAMGELGIEVDA